MAANWTVVLPENQGNTFATEKPNAAVEEEEEEEDGKASKGIDKGFDKQATVVVVVVPSKIAIIMQERSHVIVV